MRALHHLSRTVQWLMVPWCYIRSKREIGRCVRVPSVKFPIKRHHVVTVVTHHCHHLHVLFQSKTRIRNLAAVPVSLMLPEERGH